MKKLIIPVILIILFPATLHSQMFSLWADENRYSCSIYTDPDTTTYYSVYVFLEPGPTGVFGAEFKITQIENDWMMSIEKPSVSVEMGTWYGSPGISVGFIACQNDIFWVCRMNMVTIPPRTRGYITIEPHDNSNKLTVAICPDPRPSIPAYVYNYLGINRSCSMPHTDPPWLEGAEAVLRDRVLADFDLGVTLCDDTPYEFADHFLVYSLDVPYDTIRVSGGEWLDEIDSYPTSADSCLLALERNMLGGQQYMLRAIHIGRGWCYGPFGYASTEMEFVCPVIATQLQQFSASPAAGAVILEWRLSSIDPGTVFHVTRRDVDGPFKAVGEITGTAGELSYRFEDRSVSGRKTYIYRVEYVSDTDRCVLFETEEIETAPIPVTLAQNHPNPFNPSTTIEFYIPDTEHVSLQVFDVSGRLVRTLVDGASEPGSHSVTWDGLDDIGNSVPSGVYFSRLRAGKTRLSRKMILIH